MALRLMEILVPTAVEGLEEILKDQPVLSLWSHKTEKGTAVFRVLLEAEHTEPVLDLLEKRFEALEGFRVVLLPVEATLPRPERPEEQATRTPVESAQEQERERARISRKELYNDIADSARVTNIYLIAVALSSLVATIGIVRGKLLSS